MLEILDTVTNEQSEAMQNIYLKKGNGFIVIYDITRESTLNDVPGFVDQIRTKVNDPTDIQIFVVGNKKD